MGYNDPKYNQARLVKISGRHYSVGWADEGSGEMGLRKREARIALGRFNPFTPLNG